MSLRIVLVTCPPEKASELAETLVREKLVACVNILPTVESVYFWEGKLNHDKEALLILKTIPESVTALEKRVMEIHPYDTPEFVVIEADKVAEKYLAWVRASCGN